MALLGNISANQRNPQRHFGLLSSGSTAFVQGNEAGGWRQHGMTKNFPLHDGDATGSNKTGYPSGRLHPYSYSMPFKAGGLASIQVAQGVATASGAMAAGKNAAGTSAGVASATATLQLVVSGQGTAAGVATVTGNLNAALAAAGTSAGVATASASTTAKAWAYGTSNGVATATLVRYATGALAGSITPFTELSPQNLAESVWTRLMDGAFTAEDLMKIQAAALAGKVSGEPGSSITFRNLSDTVDRMVSTLDGDKNRVSLTYDVS